MNFKTPEALFLILLAFLLLGFLGLIWNQKSGFRRIASEDLIKKIGKLPSKPWFWLKSALLSLAMIFFVIALAGPRGNPHYGGSNKKSAQKQKDHEVVFFLDVSASMNVPDMRKTRLEYAKELIDAMIKEMKGETVSLYVFTTSVEKRVPPTIDYLYTRLALKNIHTEPDGTDISKIVPEIMKEEGKKKRTFIILTDGESTEGRIPEKLNLKNVIVIGMGSKAGGVVPEVQFQNGAVTSKRDDKALENLGGDYYIAEESSLYVLAKRIMNKITLNTPFVVVGSESEGSRVIYDEYYRYPLTLGLVLFILALTLPMYREE